MLSLHRRLELTRAYCSCFQAPKEAATIADRINRGWHHDWAIRLPGMRSPLLIGGEAYQVPLLGR